MLHDHKINNGLIVDLGSGCGAVAKTLLENGYDVLGIEYSAAFISRSEKKAPKAKFILGSLFDVEIPLCSAVISTNECFNYLTGISGTEVKENHCAALQALFQRVFKSLNPNGLFIFDMIEPSHQALRDKKSIVEGNDWTIFIHTFENLQLEQLTRDVTLFRQVGELYRKTKELHYVQLYNCDKIMTMLEAC